jgi:hypothetical protein
MVGWLARLEIHLGHFLLLMLRYCHPEGTDLSSQVSIDCISY